MNKIMIFNFSLYNLLLYFFIYAFLGWCLEVIYATIKTKNFINRGFLNGPVCPIYGVGVVIVLVILTPFKANPFILFFCSVGLTTLLELVTGFVLEKFFHTKWWDYSNRKFNFKGYICVKFSIIWGAICSVVVYFFHALIDDLLSKIPYVVGLVFLGIFSFLIMVDLILTILQMVHLNKVSKELATLNNVMHIPSDAIGKTLSNITLSGMEKSEILKSKFEKLRIVKAFPDLKKTINARLKIKKQNEKQE